MSKLIAFGDSFTWGSDMGDTMRHFEWEKMPLEWQKRPENRFYNLYSRRTWQAKLAEHKGLEYRCLAEQGCSNQSIVRKFFDYIPCIKEDDVVSVNFTWRDRYDFYNEEKRRWETVRPSGTEDSKYFEMYYKHIQSDYWDQIESLKAINLIIDYLIINDIDFIATCIDDNIFNDPHIKKDPIIRSLTEANDDKIKWFDGMGFHKWSKVNDYPISPMWHPLEEAHEAAFDYVLKEWNV